MDELLARIRSGDHRAVARAISRIERSEEETREIVTMLYPVTGKAHIVGITGAPGSGKSTLVNQLARVLRERELSVGIIAVDPSSPFSGGALLGDRVRMQDLAGDEHVFIRSMASRGTLGGLARATSSAVKVLDAAGFDVILIETVGAGQAEVSIADTAHTTIVVEAPGMGDDIQSIKAGILEIADILVVNKADRPGAQNTVKSLRLMLHMGQSRGRSRRQTNPPASAGNGRGAQDGEEDDEWRVSVFETVATEGEGISNVVETIFEHRAYLERSGEWFQRERERSRQEIEQILWAQLTRLLDDRVTGDDRKRLVSAVAAREIDPYTAAEQLFFQIFPQR